jgi:hypothetical protein
VTENRTERDDDLQKLLTYLRAHPEAPVTRASVATGVSEQTIGELARSGLLPVVPRGAEPAATCTCAGGTRCPVCKAEVARRIVRAVSPASRPTVDPQLAARLAGMASRRPGAR